MVFIDPSGIQTLPVEPFSFHVDEQKKQLWKEVGGVCFLKVPTSAGNIHRLHLYLQPSLGCSNIAHFRSIPVTYCKDSDHQSDLVHLSTSKFHRHFQHSELRTILSLISMFFPFFFQMSGWPYSSPPGPSSSFGISSWGPCHGEHLCCLAQPRLWHFSEVNI